MYGNGPDAAFEAAWVKMMNDQPLVCAKTGTTHEPLSVRPSVAILDVSVTSGCQWTPSPESSSCLPKLTPAITDVRPPCL